MLIGAGKTYWQVFVLFVDITLFSELIVVLFLNSFYFFSPPYVIVPLGNRPESRRQKDELSSCFICTTCDLSYESYESFDIHMGGEEHAMRVSILTSSLCLWLNNLLYLLDGLSNRHLELATTTWIRNLDPGLVIPRQWRSYQRKV